MAYARKSSPDAGLEKSFKRFKEFPLRLDGGARGGFGRRLCRRREFESKSPGPLPSEKAHTRQSGPDSGLGFQVKVLKMCSEIPSLLGR